MNIYDVWSRLKQELEGSQNKIQFKERDIFFIKMGKNIGVEQDGKGEEFKRPVVVIKKFNKECFFGVPLTSQKKEGRFYFSFPTKTKNQVAILSQFRLFSSKRLSHKIGMIGKEQFRELKGKIKDLLE